MKSLKILVLMAVMMLPLSVCAQTRLFSDLSTDKNVTTVYVSKVMMKLASSALGNMLAIGNDFGLSDGKLLEQVNTVELVTTEKKKGVKKIQKYLDKAIKKYNLVALVDSPKGNESNKQLLYEADDYEGTVTKLLIVQKSKNDMLVMVLQGNIDLNELMKE